MAENSGFDVCREDIDFLTSEIRAIEDKVGGWSDVLQGERWGPAFGKLKTMVVDEWEGPARAEQVAAACRVGLCCFG